MTFIEFNGDDVFSFEIILNFLSKDLINDGIFKNFKVSKIDTSVKCNNTEYLLLYHDTPVAYYTNYIMYDKSNTRRKVIGHKMCCNSFNDELNNQFMFIVKMTK